MILQEQTYYQEMNRMRRDRGLTAEEHDVKGSRFYMRVEEKLLWKAIGSRCYT